MRRTLLPLLFGLGLSLSATACGDDEASVANCGPGTHVENGVCVPDQVQDTLTGQDTFSQPDTSTTPTDTLVVTQDTGPFDTSVETDTFDPTTQCTAEEASTRDVGTGCSKHCQCRQDLGLSCMTFDYYLPGFNFCTKHSDNTLSSNDGYYTIYFPSMCYGGTPQSLRKEIYQRKCTDLAFCKALSAQYTHCGTESFAWVSGSAGTQCPENVGGSPGTLQTQKTCIISTLEPFVE